MIFSKQSFEAQKIAGVDSDIPVLNNLCLQQDGTVIAANGKSIVFVSPVPEGTREKMPIKSQDLTEDLVISLETAKEIASSIPQDRMFKGLLENVEIQETGKDDEILVKTTDGKRHKDMRCKTYSRKFLNIRQVLNDVLTGEKKVSVAINLVRLRTLLETLSKICPDGTGEVPAFIQVHEKATIIRTLNPKTGQRAIGLIFNYDPSSVLWVEESEWEKEMLQRTSPAMESTPGTPVQRDVTLLDVRVPEKKSFRKITASKGKGTGV